MGQIRFSADSVGLEDILTRLDRMGVLANRSDKALKAGAEVVLGEVQKLVPVRSGALKRAQRVKKRTRGGYSAIEVGSFYPDAPHAHLVDRGHGGPKPAPAHPYLTTAADNVGEEACQAIIDELNRALDS